MVIEVSLMNHMIPKRAKQFVNATNAIWYMGQTH